MLGGAFAVSSGELGKANGGGETMPRDLRLGWPMLPVLSFVGVVAVPAAVGAGSRAPLAAAWGVDGGASGAASGVTTAVFDALVSVSSSCRALGASAKSLIEMSDMSSDVR